MILQIDRRIVRPVVTLPDDVQHTYEPSRLFDDAVPEYAIIEQAAIGDYPFAMGCWVQSDDHNAFQILMWVGDKDVTDYYCALGLAGSGVGGAAYAQSHKYGAVDLQQAITTTGYSANTWHYVLGLWPSAAERHVLIDGGSKGSDTNAVGAMANHDRTAIGMARDSSPAYGASAQIFWPCIWNVIPADAEIAALSNRSDPTPSWEIQSESIVSMPHMGTLWDPFMGALWTPTGTKPANPPWIWRLRHVSMYVPPTVGQPTMRRWGGVPGMPLTGRVNW